MPAANFKRSMPHILAYEGKFSNHAADPGGRTYEGITQAVYDGYCANNGLPKRTLSKTTGSWKDWAAHRDAIYRRQYWDAVQGDDMPAGIDFVLFDAAVNSGPGRSIRLLQKALRVNRIDGVMGEATRAAIANHPDHDRLVAEMITQRRTFLKALKTWAVFGAGWSARISAVQKTGQAWATGTVGPKPASIDNASAKANVESAKSPPNSAPADVAIGGGGTMASGGIGLETARDTLAPMADGNSVIGYIVVGLTLAGIALTVGGLAWRFYAKRKADQLAEALA